MGLRKGVCLGVRMSRQELNSHFDESAFEMLRHRNVAIEALTAVLPELKSVHPHILTRVETDGECVALVHFHSV